MSDRDVHPSGCGSSYRRRSGAVDLDTISIKLKVGRDASGEEEEMEAPEVMQEETDVDPCVDTGKSQQSLSASSSQHLWDSTDDISALIKHYEPSPAEKWDIDSMPVDQLASGETTLESKISSPDSSRTVPPSTEQSPDRTRALGATASLPGRLNTSDSPTPMRKIASSNFPAGLPKRKAIEPIPFSDGTRAPRRRLTRHQDVTHSHTQFKDGGIDRRPSAPIPGPSSALDPDDPFSDSSLVGLQPEAKATDPSRPVVIVDVGIWLNGYLKQLSIGVQWEIARLISLGRLDPGRIDIRRLPELQGSNTHAASKVIRVLLPEAVDSQMDQDIVERAFMREHASKSPWIELDNEEEALLAGRLQGLGVADNWYGGKVEFTGMLHPPPQGQKGKGYRITLQRPSLGHSNRFTRRFGSSHFLRIKIPKPKSHSDSHDDSDKLFCFFCRPFVLNGRVFRAFFAKENNVFMVETIESYHEQTRSIASTCLHDASARDFRHTLFDFLQWHNPMDVNDNQTMAKWSARFALGLSNSVPGLKLEISQIRSIPEEISSSWTERCEPGKPPPEVEMTDGCGLANVAVLRQLKDKLQWQTFPTAVQCRIGGAKGLICLHPNGWHDISMPVVWLRPSQIKIQYPSDQISDPANLIIDVLRASHLKSPARLSAETIINLAENKVPKDVFINLMKDGMKELFNSLAQWNGDHAMQRLWLNVAAVSGVMNARRARELGGESRAKGLGDRDEEDNEEDDDDDEAQKFDPAVHQRSSAWWVDEISGCPSTLEETAMRLLDAGFKPNELPVLADKLKKVLDLAILRYIVRYKIVVPKSCEAFIIPDPFGILEPGEICIKSSHRLLGPDDMETDVIVGNVIVTRHPCKLPTDAQKVKAIYDVRFNGHYDVIIFSTRGDRSLASMLGGGDYDGDKVIAIWEPTIVDAFRNADPKHCTPPSCLKEQLSKNTETVSAFQKRMHECEQLTKTYEMQKFLLGALRNTSIVGMYSNMHDLAVYKLGYDDPETIRLAYMFCAVLDGSKTGLTVDAQTLKADKGKYWRRPPAWKEPTKEDRSKGERMYPNQPHARRQGNHPKFIMDRIQEQGQTDRILYLSQYEEIVQGANVDSKLDDDLVAPWRDAQKRAERNRDRDNETRMLEEMELIAEHVREIRVRHRATVALDPRTPASPFKPPDKVNFTGKPIEVRQDELRNLSKQFAEKPNVEDLLFFDKSSLSKVRASYAYLHDYEKTKSRDKKWTSFPWLVAMRELCAIKAGDTSKTITSDFYYSATMSSYVKALAGAKANS